MKIVEKNGRAVVPVVGGTAACGAPSAGAYAVAPDIYVSMKAGLRGGKKQEKKNYTVREVSGGLDRIKKAEKKTSRFTAAFFRTSGIGSRHKSVNEKIISFHLSGNAMKAKGNNQQLFMRAV